VDHATLALLIPIMALAIPVAAIVFSGMAKIARARSEGSAISPDTEARLQALEQEVGMLRQELTETTERVDFAERLLARGRDTPENG
jgi:hypothetical protein